MAGNRDAVRAALSARRKGKRSVEEEEDILLPDAPDPEEDTDITALLRAGDAELEEEDEYEEEDGEDFEEEEDAEEEDEDEWDGGDPAPKAPTKPVHANKRVAQEMAEGEEIAALRAAAAQAQAINNMMKTSPEALIQLIVQQAKAGGHDLSGILPQPQGPPRKIGNYEIAEDEYAQMTPAERLAWDRGQFLMDAPERLQRFDADLATSNLHRDYHVERLEAMVETLAELSGIELPKADIAAVDALLQQGADIKTAVAQTYRKELARLKKAQARGKKPLPRTPGNRSGAAPSLRKDAGLGEIVAYVQQHGRLPED